ncbi:hypothetical protein [Rhodococcus opacus]|uniref:hypothetical protein n=1 Tax=Rhodococcus opacus TaxID=37919 RepID=UPI002472E80B|nr:hypothetical protein [Rhodococcus opacus]MDH6291355.1 hypothetical protein [Rhodococcus opacus]
MSPPHSPGDQRPTQSDRDAHDLVNSRIASGGRTRTSTVFSVVPSGLHDIAKTYQSSGEGIRAIADAVALDPRATQLDLKEHHV